MKYDFDHWDKTEMTREEALDWFESEFEVTNGERCRPTCPQCQAEEWAIKALLVRWHKYPDEKPEKEGKYLVCCPSICCPQEPTVDILNWGKTEECDAWYIIDPTLCDINDLESGDYTVDNVYAWMPLPKPYREKDNAEIH